MLTLKSLILKRFGQKIAAEIEDDKIIRHLSVGESIVTVLENGYKDIQATDRVRVRRLSDKVFDAFESDDLKLNQDEIDLIKKCLVESTYPDFIHEKVERYLELHIEKKTEKSEHIET